MEYGKSNSFPGHDSDFMGAIFMCNNLTKKECFGRKLFGLPSVYSDLVKQIKTGMILFLFEPDERKLNGIFQATSDGAINIVSNAFSISKKCFPAQVRFERLCACRPLFENEFCEAIEENYFTTVKFSFALSGQQVCRLIWLFSSGSHLPYDQLPGGLQSEFKKIFESSSLGRTRVTRIENLPNVNAAGYNMDINIQPARNAFLLGRSKNHLTSYKNHDYEDITLQNHMIRGQCKPYPTLSRSAELQQHNQMLSSSCDDLSREAISVFPSGFPSYSSSRFLYKQPSVALGMDLLEQKLTFCGGNSLDPQKPHIRNQSYASSSCIGLKDLPMSNYSGIDISKSSCFSKPFQLTSHAPSHVNFHDFSQKAFHNIPDHSNNKFLHSSPERFQAMGSTSLCLRNARSYFRPIRQEDDSWNIQDCSAGPSYIPRSQDETLVNRDYIPVIEVDPAYAKEDFELPSRKEDSPFALQYDYNSGFTSDTNNAGNGSFDFSYNGKNSVSDLNTCRRSNTSPKRCNVFHRLSRAPKKIKHPSLDRMVEAFYHHRGKWSKGKLENLESFKTYVPLDNKTEALVEIKPRIEEFDDSNGFWMPNFKRRSVAKRQSIGASDFTEFVDKCKRRKIIRPSFTEEDNSSQIKENSQNFKGSLGFRIEANISKIPAEELSFSKESDAQGEVTGLSQDDTDSVTVHTKGNKQLDCDSEVGKSVAKESEKMNSSSFMRDENVNGKLHQASCALSMDFIPLQVEKEHEAVNTSCFSSSMNNIADLECEDKTITSDSFMEMD